MFENKKNIYFFSIFHVLTFFASSCVVLFSEFVKYKLNNKKGQNALYGNLRELYRQILIHTKYSSFLLNNPSKTVVENSFSSNASIIKNICYVIKVSYYDVFLRMNFQCENLFVDS